MLVKPDKERTKPNATEYRSDKLAINRNVPRKLGFLIPILAGLLVLMLALYVVLDNNSVKVTRVTLSDSEIGADLDGYKILQISDIYGQTFGRNNSTLLRKISSLSFDVLILTGDYVREYDPSDMSGLDCVVSIINAVRERDIPVYYILGERDIDPDSNYNMKSSTWNTCITLSESEKANNYIVCALEEAGALPVYPIVKLTKGSDSFYLTGISYYEKVFNSYDYDADRDYTICVTHKPIDYDVDARLKQVNVNKFNNVDFDASIAGHTLGGEIRLPFLGAIYLEGYGVFPQEDNTYGLHTEQGRTYYISSGLGHSGFIRLTNTPEIVLYTLSCKK